MMRLEKHHYYLEIARAVSNRSTCMRKNYGAVIVKHDTIIATGYNGTPRGWPNCCDIGFCHRKEAKRGTDYPSLCSVHAEINAIIVASRDQLLDSTLYLYGFDQDTNMLVKDPDCCPACKRTIINAGIETVIFADVDGLYPVYNSDTSLTYGYKIRDVREWVDNVEDIISRAGY